MKKVYVIPTLNCNLNCPHCEIHLRPDNFQHDLFFNELNKLSNEQLVLFGGEPLLRKERFYECVETHTFDSISTNLLLLNEEFINILKKKEISISTSWNPKRFTDEQYKLWIDKLKLLQQHNMYCTILITLTEDLLQYDMNKFLQLIADWSSIGSVNGILFEPLLDYQMKKDLHERADKWLCDLYNVWDFPIINYTVEKLKHWNCDCSNVYTLYPNGELKKGCPQYEKQFVLPQCLQCEMVNKCRPCRLQHICSFPKQLYKKVNK